MSQRRLDDQERHSARRSAADVDGPQDDALTPTTAATIDTVTEHVLLSSTSAAAATKDQQVPTDNSDAAAAANHQQPPLQHREKSTDSVVAISNRDDSWINEGDAMNLVPLEVDETLQNFYSQPFCTRYKPVLKLLVLTFFQIGGIIVSPMLSTLKTRYFDGDPKKAGSIQSYLSAGTCIVNIFLVPFYGQLLDTVGRRPLFLLSNALSAIAAILLALFPTHLIPWWTVVTASSLVQGSYSSAYLADHVPPLARPVVFPVITGMSQLILLGSIVDIVGVPLNIVLWISVAFSIASFVFCFFFIEESLPVHLRKPGKELIAAMMRNPFAGVKHMIRDPVTRFAMVILGIIIICQVGTGEVVQYYLEARIGMKPAQFAIFFVEVALLAPVIMMGIFPCLMKYLSGVGVLVISLVAVLGEQIVLATVWTAWPLYAIGVPFDVVSQMSIPVTMALVCNTGDASNQGQLMTAFAAVSDLTSAIGDIAFGAAYAELPSQDMWVAFLISSILIVMALGLTRFMTKSMHEQSKRQRERRELLPQNPIAASSTTTTIEQPTAAAANSNVAASAAPTSSPMAR